MMCFPNKMYSKPKRHDESCNIYDTPRSIVVKCMNMFKKTSRSSLPRNGLWGRRQQSHKAVGEFWDIGIGPVAGLIFNLLIARIVGKFVIAQPTGESGVWWVEVSSEWFHSFKRRVMGMDVSDAQPENGRTRWKIQEVLEKGHKPVKNLLRMVVNLFISYVAEVIEAKDNNPNWRAWAFGVGGWNLL